MSLNYVDVAEQMAKKAAYYLTPKFVQVTPKNIIDTPLGDRWKPQPCLLPKIYKKYGEEIYNFEVKKDDIYVVTFPKCGTTWSLELVWLLYNNLNFEKAKKIDIYVRATFLEFTTVLPMEKYLATTTIEIARKCPSPRIIKSHLPASLLPKEIWSVRPKIIYVARNPRDVVVSYYHHYRNLHRKDVNFPDFLDLFLNELCLWQPFHKHLLDFWNMRHEENILYLTYEEMKKDLKSVILKVAQFLDKPINDDNDLENLMKHLSFENMRYNDMVNGEGVLRELDVHSGLPRLDADFKFIREGTVGKSKPELTPEVLAKIDNWSKKQLEGSDFKFDI